jgi:hypothetical protein
MHLAFLAIIELKGLQAMIQSHNLAIGFYEIDVVLATLDDFPNLMRSVIYAIPNLLEVGIAHVGGLH